LLEKVEAEWDLLGALRRWIEPWIGTAVGVISA
jgi:hypothetical protein